MSRLQRRLARDEPGTDARLIDLLKEIRGEVRYIDRIAVEAGNHVAFILDPRVLPDSL